MKILRNILIFITLFAAILLALNVNFRQKKPVVLPCHPDKIQTLKVETEGSSFSLDLLQQEGLSNWTLRQNSGQNEADASLVQIYLRTLCSLPYLEKFSLSHSEELANYGLLPASDQISVTEDQTVLISVGQATPSGSELYLNVSSAPSEVYTISNSRKASLLPAPVELLSRTPLAGLKTMDPSQNLVLRGEGFEYNLQCRLASECHELGNQLSPTDSQKIVDALRGMKFINYHGPLKTKEAEEYGLLIPDMTLQFVSKGLITEWKFSFLDGKAYLIASVNTDEYLVYILQPEAPRVLLALLRHAQ